MATQVTLNETTVFIHPSDDPREAEKAARTGDASAKCVKYAGNWATGQGTPPTPQQILRPNPVTTTTTIHKTTDPAAAAAAVPGTTVTTTPAAPPV